MMKKYLTKKWIGIAVLVTVVLGAIGGFYYLNGGTPVTVVSADRGIVEMVIEETGTIDSRHRVMLKASAADTIETVVVRTGDVVLKDDVLAELDHKLLDSQIEGLQAQLKSVELQLLEALAPKDQALISQAQAAVQQASIGYEQAKKDLVIQQELLAGDYISQATFDVYDNQAKVTRQQLTIAQSQLLLTRKGISENVEGQFEAQIDQFESQLNALKAQLEDYVIVAPFDGVITEKLVDEGAYVMPGEPIMELSDFNEMKVVVDLLEDDLHWISQDTPLTLSFGEGDYTGKIEQIHPKAKETISELGIRQSRVEVEIQLMEGLESAIIGQEADVTFVPAKLDNVLRVPIDVVYQSQNQYFVMQVVNGVLEEQAIKVGLEGEDYYEVTEGLDEGDIVVKNLSNDLEIGLKVVVE
jgi:HlyD family secretion protein